MPKFRHKPTIVEAVQWMGPGTEHPGVKSERALVAYGNAYNDPSTGGVRRFYVVTIHGQKAYLHEGDWIIPEDAPGRYYPCKPDIFEQTYEPVDSVDAKPEAREDGKEGLALAYQIISMPKWKQDMVLQLLDQPEDADVANTFLLTCREMGLMFYRDVPDYTAGVVTAHGPLTPCDLGDWIVRDPGVEWCRAPEGVFDD